MLIAFALRISRRGQFVLEKQIGAIHIFRFTKLISNTVFSDFCVNCAFLAVSDFAVVASFMR